MAKGFFRNWLADASGSRSAGSDVLSPDWFIRHMASSPDKDIYRHLLAMEARSVPGSMLLGAQNGVLRWTHRDTSTLIVGPSRSIKCLSGEMQVIDPQSGLIHSLEEVFNKPDVAHVLTLGDHRRQVLAVPITAKVDSGWAPTLKVTTESGRSMVTTPNHRYLTPDGWVRADELQIGQTLALPHQVPEPTNPVPMELEEIDVLAALLTNGSLTGEVVGVSTSDPEIIRRLRLAGLRYGFMVKRQSAGNWSRWWDHRIVGTIDKREGDRTRPAAIRVLIERWGLDRTKSKYKTIPDCVYRLPNDQLARFLGVCFMSDGHVNKMGIPLITLASETMVRQIQHLLLRLGIQSGVRYHAARIDDKHYDAWALTVFDPRRFAALVPMWGQKKRRLAQLETRKAGTAKGLLRPSKKLRDEIQADAQSGISSGLWKRVWTEQEGRKRGTSDMWASATGQLHRPLFRKFIEVYGLQEKYGWLVNGDVWWDPIITIEPDGVQHVYDLTVEPTACFIAGDMVVHNTSGLMVPLILSHPGPVVTTSSKLDTAIATSMSRARFGRVWHFSPSEPCPAGFTELRWSPISSSSEWDNALETGRRMTSVSDVDGSSHTRSQSNDTSQHFKARAGLLLGCVFHYAALTGKQMDYVVDLVSAARLKELAKVMEELDGLGRTQVAGFLRGIIFTEDRERSGIFSTASVALSVYQLTAGLRSATNPNFDVEKFVASRMETIYITSPPGAGVAPLVVGLLGEIRRAVYANHRKMVLLGHPNHPATHFVLDELATIAPLPDLDTLLAIGGEGLIVSGAIQDLSQAKARWGDLSDGFFTLWQNVLVVRGVRDHKTLELLSLLSGDFDRLNWTESTSTNEQGEQTTSVGQQWSRQRRLPPDQISAGNPYDPDAVMMLEAGGGISWVRLLPYYRSEPWLSMQLLNAGFVMNEERYGRLRCLPLPDLDRVTTAFIDRYGDAVSRYWASIRNGHRRLGS